MKILVTGSDGFIGQNLCERLEGDNHHIAYWDLKRDVNLAYQDAPSVEIIYHLACMNQMQATLDPEQNLIENAYNARYMASEAKRVGAKLIYTSTAAVYGQKPAAPIRRTAIPSPQSDYAVAKLAGEHFVRNISPSATILRLSNIYGPFQTTSDPFCGVVGRFSEDALRGEALQVIGDGLQTRDFTFVEDVVDILVGKALETKGTFNVSHGTGTSILRLASLIQETIGSNLTVDVMAPERPVDGIRSRVLYSDFDCPTSLRVGLRKTVDWCLGSSII